jgi:hypothetical protein
MRKLNQAFQPPEWRETGIYPFRQSHRTFFMPEIGDIFLCMRLLPVEFLKNNAIFHT